MIHDDTPAPRPARLGAVLTTAVLVAVAVAGCGAGTTQNDPAPHVDGPAAPGAASDPAALNDTTSTPGSTACSRPPWNEPASPGPPSPSCTTAR